MNQNAADAHVGTRLSIFYGLFFGLVGCIAPFWGLYLSHRGYSANEIGSLLAGFAVVRIFAPNLWVQWSHLFPSPLYMVRMAGLLTAIFFSCIFWADDFWSIAAVMALYGFFWSAMLPQYEMITMRAVRNSLEAYSSIRLWGSIGFIIAVAGLGVLFDYVSMSWLPVLMLALMLGVVLNSWGLRTPAGETSASAQQSDFWRLAFRPASLAFLLMNLLLQLSHGPFYTFYSLYLEQYGYSSTWIGLLWALGVLVEVVLFWKIQRLLDWMSMASWLLISLLLTSARWVMVAWLPESLWAMLLAQTLHAFSFAMLHAVSIRYVVQLYPGAAQVKGQALYSSVGFGVGGALGAWLSGHYWDEMGGEWVFLLAALVSLAAFVVAWLGTRLK